MKIGRYNPEGYLDPTTHDALTSIEELKRKERFRPLVYVCSPLSGDIKGNQAAARRYCRYGVDSGGVPIAPHPACLTLCNAFDLVRIHLFGNDDGKQSFQDMCEFAAQDDQVKARLLLVHREEAITEFTPSPDGQSSDWTNLLIRARRSGQSENTLQ